MKSLLFLLFMIISVLLRANDTLNIIPKSDFNRWSIGVNISPEYCFRTLINNSGSPIADIVIDSRNGYEQFKIGFSAGVVANYSISKKTSFEIGMSYSDKGYSTKKTELTFGDAIDPRFGFTYPTSPVGNSTGTLAIKIFYNHIYLDVPLRALFAFGNKKTRFITGIGITSGMLLKSTYNIVYDNGDGSDKTTTENQAETFNKFNLFPEASIGVERQVSKKVSVRIQTVFKYGILKIIDTPVSANLWSGGVNFGCYYRL